MLGAPGEEPPTHILVWHHAPSASVLAALLDGGAKGGHLRVIVRFDRGGLAHEPNIGLLKPEDHPAPLTNCAAGQKKGRWKPPPRWDRATRALLSITGQCLRHRSG